MSPCPPPPYAYFSILHTIFHTTYPILTTCGATEGLLAEPADMNVGGADLLLATSVPLLLVHGTEDALVDARALEAFRPPVLPEHRHACQDIAGVTAEAAVHVSWLQGGHELLQERSPYLLALVSHVAQLRAFHLEDEWTDAVQVDDYGGDDFDVVALAEARRAKIAADAAELKAKKESKARAKREAAEAESRKKKEEVCNSAILQFCNSAISCYSVNLLFC